MKRCLAYVSMVLLVILAVSSCGARHGRLIPRDKLARIYAEMFIADQWLSEHPQAREVADTSLFYEPIFRKYGYSVKDYTYTVDEYLRDPQKFSKVLEKTASILEKQQKEEEDLLAISEAIEKANSQIMGYEAKDFRTDSTRWSRADILWGRYMGKDSLQTDSLSRDSLAICELKDTLLVDTLVQKDIIKHDGLVKKIRLHP